MNATVQKAHARLFAAMYDRSLARGEKQGMGERRSRLLGDARGVVVELGAGTGLNLEHYPAGLDELILTEPDEAMAAKLRERVAGREDVRIVSAPAEALPLEDNSADTVVSTFVLCTVPDPVAAVAEAARVLRPGGRFLFAEHVRAPRSGQARAQDILNPPWRKLVRGCNLNRDTALTIQESPLQVQRLSTFRWESGGLTSSCILGCAAR